MRLRINLQPTPEQAVRLRELQQRFAHACNWLAPIVREHRCWNRVALHHLAYHALRQAMPELGSQMACNAIYSVCRAARLVFQHPHSPFHVQRWPHPTLPLLQFADDCPVYFDRHTLSWRGQTLSLYTLEGRLHFALHLGAVEQAALNQMRLAEVALYREGQDRFHLQFGLTTAPAGTPTASGDASAPTAAPSHSATAPAAAPWPTYLRIEHTV